METEPQAKPKKSRSPLLLIPVGMGIISIFLSGKYLLPRKEVHYHAGFRVYIDNTLQNYSDSKYMLIKPCTTGKKDEDGNEQMEKAHLHDQIGDVVHVEHQGAKWRDLFQNIGVTLDKSKPVASFSDGKEIPDILSQKIIPNESVVIIIGDQSGAQDLIKNPVTTEHIKEVESQSESCGK